MPMKTTCENKKEFYFTEGIIKNNKFNKTNERSEMIVNLLCSLIQTGNIVEFSDNIKYVDKDGVILPTIAEGYAAIGKTAILVTPADIDGKLPERLTLVKTTSDNPFGEYQELITPEMLKKIKEAECFVTTKEFDGMDKRFKAWAGMGIPCAYLVYGPKNFETIKDDKNAKKFMDSLTKNNQLSVEKGTIDDELGNNIYRAYILKR